MIIQKTSMIFTSLLQNINKKCSFLAKIVYISECRLLNIMYNFTAKFVKILDVCKEFSMNVVN